MTSKRLLPIVTIFLLAAATRIINVNGWPVWTDEGWSAWAASNHQISVIWNILAADRHPPLFFLALSAWQTWTGDSRLALRFLAVGAGLITVALTYRIGKDLFGERAGLFAALLMSVLSIAVYFSQEIRNYGWLTLSVTLMTWLFVRYLKHPGRRVLIAYALSVAFMLYTLYFGAFFLAVEAIVGLFVWRAHWREKRGLIAAWIAAGALYSPWIIVITQQFQSLTHGISNTPRAFPEAAQEAIRAVFSDAAIPLIGLYALGAWFVLRRADDRPARLTILLCGIGIFLLMLGLNFKVGIIAPRTLAFLAPMIMLVCGYALSMLGLRPALLLGSVFVAYFLTSHPVIRPRLRSDQVAQTLAAQYAPGDLIVLETGLDDYAFGYEIAHELGHSIDSEIIYTYPWAIAYPQTTVIPHIEGDLRAHRRIWLVSWFVYSQAKQYLDGGGTGYRQELAYQVPVGDEYVGLYPDPTIHIAFYEKPPVPPVSLCDCDVFRFGDTLRLQDKVYSDVVQRGHTAQIDLWWSALKSPPQDYTVVAFMLNTHDILQVRDDHAPNVPTTQWKVGEMYFDRHGLYIPPDLPLGTYQLAVKVYVTDRDWLPVNGNEYTVIGAMRVVE